jgi:hypothetical protein
MLLKGRGLRSWQGLPLDDAELLEGDVQCLEEVPLEFVCGIHTPVADCCQLFRGLQLSDEV